MGSKLTGRKIQTIVSELGMKNMYPNSLASMGLGGNPIAYFNSGVRISDGYIRIGNNNLEISDMEHIHFEGRELEAMPFLALFVIRNISVLRQLESIANEVGQAKFISGLPFSRKGIHNELIEVYGCSEDELIANVLADLYSIDKSSDMMKFLSTTYRYNSGSDADTIPAYVIALTRHPLNFYKVAYSTVYASIMGEAIAIPKAEDRREEFNEEYKQLQITYKLDSKQKISQLLALNWLLEIMEKVKDNNADKVKKIVPILSEALPDGYKDTSQFYKYLTGEFNTDKYVTECISSHEGISLVRRQKIAECEHSTEEDFIKLYKDITGLTGVSEIFNAYTCEHLITLDNAINSLIKSQGEKVFKTKYLQLFSDNEDLVKKIKDIEGENQQAEKSHAKEVKALVSENRKLKKEIKNKEDENSRLKLNSAHEKEKLVSIQETERLQGIIDGLKNDVSTLNSNLDARNKKYEDIVCEVERLREKLSLYGISPDDVEDSEIYKVLSKEDIVEDNGVPIEEKLDFLNKYKIAICGSKSDLINRVVDRGIETITHIDQIGNCKKNGKYDLYVICTDFISHPLRWQVETKVKEQGAIMVYFTGTNIDRMINVMYQTLIK